MTTPVDQETKVGYCVAADVYCSFTEYYGDGTVYGWRHLYIGEEVVRGAGKTKRQLIEAGAFQEEAICPTVPADVVIVELDAAVPADAAPADAAVPADAAAPAAPTVPSDVKVEIEKGIRSVKVKLNGITVTCNSKIQTDIFVTVDEEGKTVEFTL